MRRNCLLSGMIASWIALVAACTGDIVRSDDRAAADDAGASVECREDVDCHDDNPCTDDVCSAAGSCARTANSAPCDDGNNCTQNDTCAGSTCVAGNNTCTCNELADCTAFEDDDLCNGTLICSAEDLCEIAPATVVVCATGGDTACAKNTCQPATGSCEMVAALPGTACDDSDSCTAAESCQGGVCRGREACCADEVNNDGDEYTDCEDPDCVLDAACEVECEELEPVDEAPLPVQAASNAVSSTTANGYNDDYIHNQESSRKLGLRRNWGGAIVFFGLDTGSAGTNTTNTIDGADTGREVQIAMYDHDRWYQSCAWNASCSTAGSSCEPTMTFFGWNPVQGGNRCNNGSGYDSVALEDGAATLTTTPLQWNPHWDRSDCNSNACGDPSVNTLRSDVQLTQRVRFVREDVVELSYRVLNLGDLDHRPAAHEFPTVYAAYGKDGTPDLYRLFDSSGIEITSGWSVDAHGFRYQNFTSPGGWASLQNAGADYGVGLYYETGMGSFQAWNKAADPKFNNFRGLFSFGLAPYAEVRARSYLILGAIASIGAQAQWLENSLAPFGSLDEPVADATVSGVISVRGWALDNKAVSQVQMIVDGGAPVTLGYGGSRPDVCMVWPGYSACAGANVGFQGSLNTSALAADPCGHVLEINVIDNQGNQHIIARRRFYLAP